MRDRMDGFAAAAMGAALALPGILGESARSGAGRYETLPERERRERDASRRRHLARHRGRRR